MTLTINGEDRTFDESLSLPDLLGQLGLKDKPVVVEWNEKALSPSGFSDVTLSTGDRLEIITIAAGG